MDIEPKYHEVNEQFCNITVWPKIVFFDGLEMEPRYNQVESYCRNKESRMIPQLQKTFWNSSMMSYRVSKTKILEFFRGLTSWNYEMIFSDIEEITLCTCITIYYHNALYLLPYHLQTIQS